MNTNEEIVNTASHCAHELSPQPRLNVWTKLLCVMTLRYPKTTPAWAARADCGSEKWDQN